MGNDKPEEIDAGGEARRDREPQGTVTVSYGPVTIDEDAGKSVTAAYPQGPDDVGWVATPTDHFVLTEGEGGRLYAVSALNESEWVYLAEQGAWQRLDNSISNWTWNPEIRDWSFTGKREGELKVDVTAPDGQARVWEIHHALFMASSDGYFIKYGGEVAQRRPEAGQWHEVTKKAFDSARILNQDLQVIWETPGHPGQEALIYVDGVLKATEKGMEIYLRSAVFIGEHVSPWGKAAAFVIDALETDEALSKANSIEDKLQIFADAMAPGPPSLPDAPHRVRTDTTLEGDAAPAATGGKTNKASDPAGRELEDFRAMVREETGGEPRGGEPLELLPYALRGKAGKERDLSSDYQAAHGLPQAVGKRNVPGYKERAALTTLHERWVHEGMDRHWKEATQQMRRDGRETATVQEIQDLVAESIQRSELPQATKDSLKARLQDEMFIEFELDPGMELDLPYPNIEPADPLSTAGAASSMTGAGRTTTRQSTEAEPETAASDDSTLDDSKAGEPKTDFGQPVDAERAENESAAGRSQDSGWFNMEQDVARQSFDMEAEAEQGEFRMDRELFGELPDGADSARFDELPDRGASAQTPIEKEAVDVDGAEEGAEQSGP